MTLGAGGKGNWHGVAGRNAVSRGSHFSRFKIPAGYSRARALDICLGLGYGATQRLRWCRQLDGLMADEIAMARKRSLLIGLDSFTIGI
jgi:hypothetical protein